MAETTRLGWTFQVNYLDTEFVEKYVDCFWKRNLFVSCCDPHLENNYLFYKEEKDHDYYKISFEGSAIKDLKVKSYYCFKIHENNNLDVYVLDMEGRVYVMKGDIAEIVNEEKFERTLETDNKDIFSNSYSSFEIKMQVDEENHKSFYCHYYSNDHKVDIVFVKPGKTVENSTGIFIVVDNSFFQYITSGNEVKKCFPFTKQIYQFQRSTKNLLRLKMTKEEFELESENFKKLDYVNMFIIFNLKENCYCLICDYNKPINDEKNMKEEIIETRYVGESKIVTIHKADEEINKVEIISKDFVLTFEKNTKKKIFFDEEIATEITTYEKDILFPHESEIKFNFDYEEIEIVE